MNGVEDPSWSETLPTLPALNSMIENFEEE